MARGAGGRVTNQDTGREALDRWSASLARTPGLAEVMASGDISLIGAFVFETFRVTAVELAKETEGLERVRQMALEVYSGDQEAAARFLTRKHLKLEDKTPLEIAVSSEEGAETVLNLLGTAAYVGHV